MRNWERGHREWRCKTCNKVVRRRTHHNAPTGMECIGRAFEEIGAQSR
jgi:hypothetical protein